MAVIAPTSRAQKDLFTVTKTTLTSADTLVFVPGTGQILELINTTGSPVVVTVKGNTATTYSANGYGTISLSAGKGLTVAATSTAAINLDTISVWLAGTVVNVTGGTGVTAVLYN